ncbi:hypothetical protein PC110_g251 [Phytophthora cactorum]|uniref:Integrase catalytic domain-containing protein n=1 Tax=Phytophthora cactorum TaxID=29920 RepID=A0A329T4L4_9STRA|nr:hypothetical protein PC110_g251 [Phytophthora cactorum]
MDARLVIPDNEDLKGRVICENHDVVTAGHPGYIKTYLGVQKRINDSRERSHYGHRGPLDEEGKVYRNYYISDSRRGCYAVKDHGGAKSIISGGDSKFTSKFWQEVIKTLETTHKLSSAFSPQTDGQPKRTNRFIEDYLRGVVNLFQNDWDEYRQLAEFAYNQRFHSSISMSPFKTALGYVPYMPDDVARHPEFEQLHESASEFSSNKTSYYDKNRLAQDFKPGDLVLLDGRNWDIRHKGFAQAKKLAPRFIGSYPIVKQIQQDSYELKLSKGLRLHPVFHTSLLKPYCNDKLRRQNVYKVILSDGTEGQLVREVIWPPTSQKKITVSDLVAWRTEGSRYLGTSLRT